MVFENLWWLAAAATFLLSQVAFVGAQEQSQATILAGKYDKLEPAQKRLVDNWFARYNEVMSQNQDPQSGYDSLTRSTKTTFEAVTNALLATELTDPSGASMGRAIDIIEQLDDVAGKIKGAGGDKQYRLYVTLKPGARELVEKSVQFKRGADNTVYHKEYPLNYRLQGGTPSIQVSMSRDGSRADIDVDYRASSFPKALINGHLTSANSDVTAGNNFDRHQGRWSGLQNWWEEWFGLPFVRADDPGEAVSEGVPAKPAKGRGKVNEAVLDFLEIWLVKAQPRLAMAYVSEKAFRCEDEGSEEPVDRGMASFKMLAGMRSVNRQLGNVSKLGDVLIGVRIAEPGLRVVQHPDYSSFVLYQVSDERAIQFECENRGVSELEIPKGASQSYGKYFATLFHLSSPSLQGETIALLWAKESGNWKIVAYETDPFGHESAAPDLRPAPVVAAAATRVKGDPGFVKAATDFYTTWLIDRNYRKALGYFAAASFACNNLFLLPGDSPVTSDEDGRARILGGLKNISEELGRPTKLNQIIEGLDLRNPEIRVVIQDQEDAFTLAELPDYEGEFYQCDYRLNGGVPKDSDGSPVYGHYFGSGWKARMVEGDTAVLYLFWNKMGDQWKIQAFHLESP
jgi:hypothetical protein